jgi:hypothetical protein
MAAILLEADEIIVKPFEAGRLAELLHEKVLTRKPVAEWRNRGLRRYCTAAFPASSRTG